MGRWILGLGLLSVTLLTLLTGVVWFKVGGGMALVHVGTLTLLLLLLSVGLGAYNTLCGALFSKPSQACRTQLQQRPLRCYLMGVLTVLAQIWLCMHVHALAIPLVLANAAWLSFSLPALAGLAGEGIGVSGRWAPLAGSMPLCLTVALPVLGWLCLVQLILAALGSATMPGAWQR
jgi:hypothetical protein